MSVVVLVLIVFEDTQYSQATISDTYMLYVPVNGTPH